MSLEAVLEDGRTVSLSYFGTFAAAESLDEIIPSVVAENEYKYYNSDGELSITRQLGTSYMKENNGNFTFYLIPEGDDKTSYDRVEIKVGSDLINAGEIDLANIGKEKVFDIKYKAGGIQLQSYAASYGYGNMPNNGTLTVSKDDNDMYEILLDVTNNYPFVVSTNNAKYFQSLRVRNDASHYLTATYNSGSFAAGTTKCRDTNISTDAVKQQVMQSGWAFVKEPGTINKFRIYNEATGNLQLHLQNQNNSTAATMAASVPALVVGSSISARVSVSRISLSPTACILVMMPMKPVYISVFSEI